MHMIRNGKRFIAILSFAALAALPTGCGSGDSDTSAQVQEEIVQLLNVITDFSDAVLALRHDLPLKFSASLGGGTADFRALLGTLRDGMPSTPLYPDVRTYRFSYTAAGFAQPLSGLVVVPSSPLFSRPHNLPMISLQHPTQVLRSQSPSLVPWAEDEELTVPYAMMLAARGFIVLIPDYPGLGTNIEVHPYCHQSLGKVVAAMIAAATTGSQPWSARAVWDGRLFLVGFSEGGYATLAAAREIKATHPSWNLQGVAALDGPYDLSGTMRNLMLTANASFSAPYFLPYVVAGYADAYPLEASLKFNAAVLAMPVGSPSLPLNEKLYPLLFGANTAEEINGVMSEVPAYAGPASILTAPYLADLGNPASRIYLKLEENDAYRGWTPAAATQVLFYHNLDDDLVPFGNFTAAQAAWGTPTNLTYQTATDDIPGLGSIHAGTLVPAYIYAAQWLNGIAYP